MAENETKTPAQAPGDAKAAKNSEEVLSSKRRVALVSYLAVLFAVAFLLVALSMIVENKKLQSSNRELENDKQQTSATLTGKIEGLQAENRQLQSQLTQAEQDKQALNAELEAEKTKVSEAEELAAQAQAQAEEQKQANEALANQKEELSDRLEDSARAYDLLLTAMLQSEENALEELAATLEDLAPLEDLLSEQARELLDEIRID